MKLASFSVDHEQHFGLVSEMGVLDITTSIQEYLKDWVGPNSISEYLAGGEEAHGKLEELTRRLLGREGRFMRNLLDVKFLPPIPTPGKILCVGLNYYSHGKEAGGVPSEPYFFFKPFTSVAGDGDDIIIPKFSVKPDHEVELGVVIGRRGKDIHSDEAYNYLAGYTVINDISFRDGSLRGIEGTILGRNWYKGKVADSSLPMGPCLVTRDEIPDPYPLNLQLRVNGELRQEGTTNDMIFRIPTLLSSASEGNTLFPGDVIATGTCSGVGLYTGKYLKDGDIVEARVEKVGMVRNQIRFQK
jgi:2-keto-4-pentenoate hydratase/2-oxohepta-3-ene-1,7-dioic acid hydratase in catechol pathway